MRETPDANVETMTDYFVQATQAYATALELNPKLLPACEGLMAIGRQSSDELQAIATQKCVALDPASYYVVQEMMAAAEPRWGGSDIAMRTIAAYAQARVEANPVLSLFAFEHAYYDIDQLDDSDEQAIAVLEPAAQQVPNAAYMRLVGGAYLRRDQDWKALVYLSQALRFAPDEAEEMRFMAIALGGLGDLEWTRRAAERALVLDPKDGFAQRLLGSVIYRLEGPAASLPYFKRAMEFPKIRETASLNYCSTLFDTSQRDAGRKCVDDVIAEYPDNPEAWRLRLVDLGVDAPGSVEAMERFLALHDPKRWPSHAAAAETARKVLAVKNGTASPAQVFDVRVMRARALERSAPGRAWLKQGISGRTESFNAAMRACQSSMPPGAKPEFTAVMDVQPDGSVAHVAMRPVDALTSCLARTFERDLKLPAPPAIGDAAGYPIFFEVTFK
jgi:Tfp pilus assembly protein PilF